MFRSMGLYAVKVAIRHAGPANVYRDVLRLTRKHVPNATKRKHVNHTVRFFLRNEHATFEQVVEHPNIRYLVTHAGKDIKAHPLFSHFSK